MSRLVYAITGGIASGKSAVCDLLAAHGATIIDADQVARDLVEPGQPALADIVAHFGADILEPGGRLNRRKLREIIFADANQRRTLEAILHPRVRTELKRRAEAAPDPYCVLAIPLLVESGPHYDWVDGVIVVDVSEDTQIRRLTARDGISEALARQMIAAQVTRDARLAIADWVVNNDGDREELAGRVAALHMDLMAPAD